MATNPPLDLHAVTLFYFVKDLQGNVSDPRIYEKYDTRRPLSPRGAITQLVANAAADGESPCPYTTDYRKYFMRRKCYLAMALESDRAYPVQGETISFADTLGPAGGHTFTNLGGFVLEDDNALGHRFISILYARNDLQKRGGPGDLGDGDREHYTMTLPFLPRVGFVPGTGGTNMGPPVPPP